MTGGTQAWGGAGNRGVPGIWGGLWGGEGSRGGAGSPPASHCAPPQDEKYWSRRSKNNAAAKRSRDARRLKENQISVRAAFLERENAALRQEVAAARRELARFRTLLARYEARHGAL